MNRGDLFLTTRWSLILRAADSHAPEAHAALSDLCATYWYPLYAYLRRRGHSSHDAEDLTQGFFARLLRLGSLKRAEATHGKFRAYLLASLKHYLADVRDKSNALKRGSGSVISIDPTKAEQRYEAEGERALSPEELFERQWAITLLEEVLQRVQTDYLQSGREGQFATLKFAITGERSALPYTELATNLGISEKSVKVAVHRLRQRYRKTLKQVIRETVTSEAEAEEELQALRRALSRR